MVSIIIPCYNIAHCLSKTFESVLKQTDPNWEIIAIDDGSTDNTIDIIKKFAKNDNRIKLFSKSNGGVSSARNLGLSFAKGDWIYFLDGDDLIDETLVENINLQKEDTDVFVFEFVKESNNNARYYHLYNHSSLFKDFFINKQTINISSLSTRRNLIEQNKLRFDEQTYYAEDREFIAKIFILRPRYKIFKKVLFHYQVREGSVTLVRAYTDKRLTSILSGERTWKSLRYAPEGKKAFTNFACTIARHLKMYYEFENVDNGIEDILLKYKDKYLKGFHFYGWGKMEIYTSIAGIFSYHMPLFKLFLKLI